MRDIGSVWRGLRTMRSPLEFLRHWYVRAEKRGFWASWWTPAWHEGRGSYVSLGLGLFAIYRGY